MTRPLIVGQSPASPAHEQLPALANTRSGHRLARLAGLTDTEELLSLFDTVNLLAVYVERLDLGVAREPARRLRDRIALGRRELVVCLGPTVARALGITAVPVLGVSDRAARWRSPARRGPVWAVSPHPSGRNRFWNEPANVTAAEAFWRDLAERARALKREAPQGLPGG